jgi:hypothetical protein
MENEKYHCCLHVVRIYALFTCSDLKSVVVSSIHHALFVLLIPGERSNPSHVKNSTTFHKKFSPFVEEKKVSSFSILGERATSPFCILHSPRMGRKRCDNLRDIDQRDHMQHKVHLEVSNSQHFTGKFPKSRQIWMYSRF